MKALIASEVKGLLNQYTLRVCKKEYEGQRFLRFNERPVEFSFVFRQLSRLYPKTVLDVGTGTTALPTLMRNCGFVVTAVDNIRDYWPRGMTNRHYHVIDDDITKTQLRDSFDLITCVSVLEHIRDASAAVENMISLLRQGGHLIMTFPYCEKSYVPNVYALEGSGRGKGVSYVTQAFSRRELDTWVKSFGGCIVEQEYWRFWDGEFWTLGKEIFPPQRVDKDELHQLTCVCIQKAGGQRRADFGSGNQG